MGIRKKKKTTKRTIAKVIEDMVRKGKMGDASSVGDIPAEEFVKHFDETNIKTHTKRLKWGEIINNPEALRTQIQHMLWEVGISSQDRIKWKANHKKGELLVFK